MDERTHRAVGVGNVGMQAFDRIAQQRKHKTRRIGSRSTMHNEIFERVALNVVHDHPKLAPIVFAEHNARHSTERSALLLSSIQQFIRAADANACIDGLTNKIPIRTRQWILAAHKLGHLVGRALEHAHASIRSAFGRVGRTRARPAEPALKKPRELHLEFVCLNVIVHVAMIPPRPDKLSGA